MSGLIINEMKYGSFDEYGGCGMDVMTVNVCSVSYAIDGDESWIHCIGSKDGFAFVTSAEDIHDRIVDTSIFEEHPRFYDDFGIYEFYGVRIDYDDLETDYMEKGGRDPAAILLTVMLAMILR